MKQINPVSKARAERKCGCGCGWVSESVPPPGSLLHPPRPLPLCFPSRQAFLKEKYTPQFTLMSKVEMNGGGQHPVFAWLKSRAPATPGKRTGGLSLSRACSYELALMMVCV